MRKTRVPWKRRYEELTKLLRDHHGGARLLLTERQFIEECSGAKYRPPIACGGCGNRVDTSSINNLDQRQRLGCRYCCFQPYTRDDSRPWTERRAEFETMLAARGAELLTPANVWEREAAAHWAPQIRCAGGCGRVSKLTTIHSVLRGRPLRCACAGGAGSGDSESELEESDEPSEAEA